MNNDSFYLQELSDEELDHIINLSPTDFVKYVHNLICNYYSNTPIGSERYNALLNSYRGSFTTEYIYRNNPILHKNFTVIYTRTGLIREMVNDLYEIGPEKLVFQ